MKKILLTTIIALTGIFLTAQSWDAYYGKLPDGSVVGIDSVQILVIDAETNQTYYMLVSQLTVAHLAAPPPAPMDRVRYILMDRGNIMYVNGF